MSSLREIARLAGVDISTVSRALNDSPRVKKSTKDLIKRLAAEHNYVPDQIARGLVSRRTYTVGIVIPEFRNTFYAEIIEGLEGRLSEEGFSLLFGKSDFNQDKEISYFDILISKRVDGIIGCSISEHTLEVFTKRNKGIPLVLIDTYFKQNDYDTVTIDNTYGVEKVVEHLAALGHKRIGFIGDKVVTAERLEAFKRAAGKFGIEESDRYIAIGSERYEAGGYLRMKELLGSNNIPSAVFAETDNLAIGAIRALRENKIKIPDEMSVIGFDDIAVSSFVDVPLTTVVQPKYEMGITAARFLLDRISRKYQGSPRQLQIKPELVIRNTTTDISKRF